MEGKKQLEKQIKAIRATLRGLLDSIDYVSLTLENLIIQTDYEAIHGDKDDDTGSD